MNSETKLALLNQADDHGYARANPDRHRHCQAAGESGYLAG